MDGERLERCGTANGVLLGAVCFAAGALGAAVALTLWAWRG